MADYSDPSDSSARVGAIGRLLMQVRLLLVGVTLFLLAGDSFSAGTMIALGTAGICSLLAIHHWDRIVAVVIRHPALLGLDVLLSFTVLELGGPLGPFFLFTVITAAVAGLLYRWRGVAYFCSLQVVCYYCVLALSATTDELLSFQALVGQPAYYPLVGFVGVRVRRLLDEQSELAEQRREAEVNAAAADERTRLAREMHDSLAKTLRGIAMSAKALPMWVSRSPERASEEALRMATDAEVASREARELISDLRSKQLAMPLLTSIQETAESWSRYTGIPVRVNETEEIPLSVVARYEALSVLKEALANVARHSGASEVVVSLAVEDGDAVLAVTDDGHGFDSEEDASRRGHYGIVGMAERAKRGGGSLDLRSERGCGTTVRACFPQRPEGSHPGRSHGAIVEPDPSSGNSNSSTYEEQQSRGVAVMSWFGKRAWRRRTEVEAQ